MYWTDDAKINQYAQAFGSKFAAINYISILARHRRNSVHNCITESQALAWVVTGIEPEDVKQYYESMKRFKERKNLYVEDRLYYIEDNLIRDAVRITIQESRQNRHLIYNYNKVIDEAYRARVRVLSNMIWDELRQFDVESKI